MDRRKQNNSIDDDCRIAIVRRAAAPALSDARIRQAVRHTLRRHKIRGGELEVAILGTAAMGRLNEQWLGHEGATDVITFDLSDEPAGKGRPVCGQVNVCWPVAQREARKRRVEPAMELLLYVVHGVLHLAGHDDHDPAAAARMHKREDELLGELGFPPVYARPVQ